MDDSSSSRSHSRSRSISSSEERRENEANPDTDVDQTHDTLLGEPYPIEVRIPHLPHLEQSFVHMVSASETVGGLREAITQQTPFNGVDISLCLGSTADGTTSQALDDDATLLRSVAPVNSCVCVAYSNKKILKRMTEEVKQGRKLRDCPDWAKQDDTIVRTAVEQHGASLGYACRALRASKSIVLLAVTQDSAALKYAAPSLRNDPDVIAAVQKAEIEEASLLDTESTPATREREFPENDKDGDKATPLESKEPEKQSEETLKNAQICASNPTPSLGSEPDVMASQKE